MGKVNEYINKIIISLSELRYNKDKPWLRYYDRMPEHLNYYNGSMYDMVYDTSLKYPDYVALEYFDNKYTYKDFTNFENAKAKEEGQTNYINLKSKFLSAEENKDIFICINGIGSCENGYNNYCSTRPDVCKTS